VKRSPYLIVIEGLSGSGKHTQANLLKKTLVAEGYDVELLSFPRYEEPTGKALKRVLVAKTEFSAREMTMLYAVDRFGAKPLLIQPSHSKKRNVIILDRYVTSSAVIQTVQLQLSGASKKEIHKFQRWHEDLEYGIFGVPHENQVVFLDVSIDITLKLVKKREQKNVHNRERDNFEKNIVMQKEIYKTLQYFAAKRSHWERIPCMKEGVFLPAEVIAQLVRAAITL
jgi:thymidylate kinase